MNESSGIENKRGKAGVGIDYYYTREILYEIRKFTVQEARSTALGRMKKELQDALYSPFVKAQRDKRLRETQSNPIFGQNLLTKEHSLQNCSLSSKYRLVHGRWSLERSFSTTDPKEFDNNRIPTKRNLIHFESFRRNLLFFNRSTPTFPNDCIALSLDLFQYDHGHSIAVPDSHFHESCR
jgi:hypothetical protein